MSRKPAVPRSSLSLIPGGRTKQAESGPPADPPRVISQRMLRQHDLLRVAHEESRAELAAMLSLGYSVEPGELTVDAHGEIVLAADGSRRSKDYPPAQKVGGNRRVPRPILLHTRAPAGG